MKVHIVYIGGCDYWSFVIVQAQTEPKQRVLFHYSVCYTEQGCLHDIQEVSDSHWCCPYTLGCGNKEIIFFVGSCLATKVFTANLPAMGRGWVIIK